MLLSNSNESSLLFHFHSSNFTDSDKDKTFKLLIRLSGFCVKKVILWLKNWNVSFYICFADLGFSFFFF